MTLTGEQKREIARENGLVNVGAIWNQSARVGLPFYIACALVEKESGGRNVYGHDVDGALSGFPFPVNEENYRVFHWLVFDKGQKSNGVGPLQITFKGHFPVMEREGLDPWRVSDNLFYGFRLFRGYLTDAKGDIVAAGRRYNGALSYGIDLADKAEVWHRRFGA